MNCKLYFFLILVLFANEVGCKAKAVFEFLKLSKELISVSFDLASILNDNDNDEVLSKLTEIQKQIDDTLSYIDMKIDNLKIFITEEIFFNGLNRDIQDINSCLTDYYYFKKDMNDKGLQDNFWNRCNGIITPLRKIRSILIGAKVIGNNALVNHLKEKEGFCNGTTISRVFLYISKFYVEGCATFVLAQKYKHGNSSKPYLEECNNGLSDITDYMKSFYESCAKIVCSDKFQIKLSSLHIGVEKWSKANETVSTLKEIFPYLEFIVIQKNLKKSQTCITKVNELEHKTFSGTEFQFDVYALPSDVHNSNMSNQHQPIIEVESPLFIAIATSNIKVESIHLKGMSIHVIVPNVTETPCFYEFAIPTSATASSLFVITGLILLQFASLLFIM
ncbi:uncharacterized protein LOC134272584 [Saccostrea cucullata]|uniref:uncharacterized protein LOC134272584 n=1 Tax=Saccostrea cuccullata TaxID=36930 RepID=UPI002ED6145E